MAMIQCPECGQEISGTSEKCIHCGKVLVKKANKKPVIIGVVIVAIAVIIGLVLSFGGTILNEDEQLAYENAVTLKNMMKDPDSFKLYENDMYLLKFVDEEGNVGSIYTFFKYGGTNSYGAVLTDEAMFSENEYLGDYDDEIDMSEPEADDKATLEHKVDARRAQLILERYWAGEYEDIIEKVDIDVKKIKKKMGLN